MLHRARAATVLAALLWLIPPAAARAGFDVSPTSATKTEGESADFTLSNNCVPIATCRIHWATVNDTAVEPGDYTATSGFADFNILTPKTVTISTTDDSIHEYGAETLKLDVIDPGPNPDEVKTATLTIGDNDPEPAIAIADATVNESQGELSFTLTKPQAGSRAVSVDWSTAAGTASAGADYGHRTGTVTWSALQTDEKVITVPVVADQLDEFNETVAVNLSGAVDASISDSQGMGTIVDVDPQPTLSIGDVQVSEGDSGTKDIAFALSLSPASGKVVNVSYSTGVGGTALPGFDFLAANPAVVTFAAGETSRTAVVQVLGDQLDEGDETIRVILTDPLNATVGDGEAIATVVDDDTVLPDRDADGFDDGQDCDDLAPAVHPGAPEVADNGIDENCDGIDTVNFDRDGDGYNRPQDCRDGDPAIHPTAPDVPANGVDEDCVGGDADYAVVSAGISYEWSFQGRKAWPRLLKVTRVLAGSTVTITCKGRRKGCPFGSRELEGTGDDLNVKRLFRGKKLKRGAKVTIEVTAPGMTAKVVSFKVRDGKSPRGGKYRCRRPGASSTTACPAG